MKRKLKEALSSIAWQYAPLTILVFFVLILVISSGVMIWQQSYRTNPVMSLASNLNYLLLKSLSPLFVALGFWCTGLIAWIISKRYLSSVFFIMVAGVLGAGLMSTLDSYIGRWLFHLLLAWTSPVLIHFHIELLEQPSGRIERLILTIFYGLAAVWSLPIITGIGTNLAEFSWFPLLWSGIRLNFFLSFIPAMFILARNYWKHTSLSTRGRIRLITFSTIFAFVPMLLLSLLPETLGAPFYIPYELTFPGLLFSPLTYAYTLVRHQLVKVETVLNRVVIYYMLITLLVSFYLLALSVLNPFSLNLNSPTFISIPLLVCLLILFVPLEEGIRWLMNWILYGGDINYSKIIGQLSETLSLALDRETLQNLLVDKLTSVMRLNGSILLLRDHYDNLNIQHAIGFPVEEIAHYQLCKDSHLVTYLEAAAKPITSTQIRQVLSKVTLSANEHALISLPDIAFWLPLTSGGNLWGLLLVTSRRGGDLFITEERRILATIAPQAGIAAHNVWLIEQVRARGQELSRAHQQLLIGYEQEQKRLARELHDSVVQQLLGISYQVIKLRQSINNWSHWNMYNIRELVSDVETVRGEILKVTVEIRQLIGELRPPGLDELGLTAALEDYIIHLKRVYDEEIPQVELDLAKIGTSLPEPIATCLFRIAQEALHNILRHAQARHIKINLSLFPHEIVLSVCDDGRGFHVPTHLGQLTRENHFGLVGMAERVNWVDGQLTILSQLWAGTQIIVRVPLN